MAPEHPDVFRLAAGTADEQAVHDYVNHALTESAEERGDADKTKTGVYLGRTVTNPVTGEEIPMYVADYVLMEYGTGAIMAVPAHDERDFAFARAYDLPIRQVVAPRDGSPMPADEPYVTKADDAVLINSGQFDGLTPTEGFDGIVAWLDREGIGHAVGELPAARLAGLPPALLGLPDPDRLLRRARHGSGARGPAAGRAAGGRGLPAQGSLSAGRGRGLGQHDLPECGGRPAARPTRWTRSSTRAGTSCATAMPATTTRHGIRRYCASG